MTSPRITSTLIALTLATSLTLGALTACSQSETADPAAGSASHEETLWTCSMHPQVLEDEPGTCPICGMELVPTTAAGKSESSRDQSTGMSIDPVVVQNMGVRLERVKREPLFRHVRTIGQVDVAEDAVSVVNPRFSGWAERIHADKTGDSIEAGQPLVEIYSPELVAAQEEYLLAIRTQGPKSELARSARRKLGLLGLDDRDVKVLASTRRVQRAVPIRAPRSGYVLHKNVVEGARVPAGQDLYTIGDLSRIWVQAEVYEHDAPWVEVGQPAQMELTYERGGAIEGSVAYVYPTLNEVSRTLSVRLEFPNPELRLKPGMFATVYIQFQRVDDSLVVPTEAILHSGRREIVFVSLGEGHFEPREITTGLVGDRHTTQVLSGLREGEEVVTSGQFLLDSESQLQEAIAKMSRRRAGLDPADAPRAETLYACPMHPEQTADEPGRCPICGMDLEPRAPAPSTPAGGDGHEDAGHAHPAGEDR